MNKVENKEARLLNVKVNNTAVLIIFYLSFTMILGYIPSFFYFSYFVSNLLETSISDLLSYFDLRFLLSILSFFLFLIIVSLLLYLLIKCVIIRYSYRRSEESGPKWLFFRLNKSSAIVLFILSLINLIINLNSLNTSIGSLTIYLEVSYMPTFIINEYITGIIISIILILINVYTLIITIKNRDAF